MNTGPLSNMISIDPENPPSVRQSMILSFSIMGIVLLHLAILYWLRQNYREVAPGVTGWWSNRGAGFVGGFGGGGIGLIGGLVGTLCGCGVARRFTLGLMATMAIVGAVATVVGITAIATGQPYHVWYPLMLSGPMSAVLFGLLIPVAKMGYTRRELMKIQSLDS